MKISINEPCHENWEAMTPNQQGAFCGSCQKDVVDFSKMSIQGIKNFFSKPQGKVCGRFEETQLQELSFDDFFAKFTYWNFSKKFAVIFFMAFGFWIFSNSSAFAQREMHLKGDVAYEPQKPKVVQKETPQTFLQGQTVIMDKPAVKQEPKKPETKKLMGKIKCTRPEPKEKPVKVKDSTLVEPVNKIEPRDMVVGMIAYIPQEEKKPVVAEVKNPVEIVNKQTTIKVVEVKKHLPAEEAKTSKENKVIVFPNPSNGSFTVETKEKQTLNIFDGTGKIVHTQTVSGNAQVNASHLADGIYTISLTGAGNPVVKKIIITR